MGGQESLVRSGPGPVFEKINIPSEQSVPPSAGQGWAIIGSPAKLHLNGIWLDGLTLSLLGSFAIFRGSIPVFLWEPESDPGFLGRGAICIMLCEVGGGSLC